MPQSEQTVVEAVVVLTSGGLQRFLTGSCVLQLAEVFPLSAAFPETTLQ